MKSCSIVVVEDDLVTSVTLSKAIRVGVPNATVLTARSLAEARLVLQEYSISFFILDINLPDGSGIDFVFDVTQASPEATIVLMTSTPLPEYRDRAEAFGVMHFLTKPINHQSLVALILESRTAPLAGRESGTTLLGSSLNRLKRLVGMAEESTAVIPSAKEGDTTFFQAALTQLSVLDIIQLKCLNSTNQGMLFKSRKHGEGRVFFQNGDIVHAETARATGMAALSEIIGWKGGQAEEIPEGAPHLRTISGSWQNTLLIAAHAADDERAK